MQSDEHAIEQALELDIESNEVDDFEQLEMKGRNSRRPKNPNHGARPCSSYMRKMKKKGWHRNTQSKD